MKYIYTILLSAVVALSGVVGFHLEKKNAEQDRLGADTVRTIGGQSYTLAGSGLSSTATSIQLTSLTIPQTGYELTDSDFSNTFYITLEPGSRSRQEFVSCTTVTQNSDDTATLSGCTRGLLPFSPYTASSTYQFSHSGGTSVIFSNPPQLYEQAAFKDNDETITGSWGFPTPLGGSNPATKTYVDNLVNGGTVTNEAIVFAGNAGETVATGTLVYFDGSDQEWKKVDVDTTTTYVDKFLGITQGNGTDGAAITGGILTYGRDNTQTGLTPGSTYYASTTAGVLTTTATNQPIGVADDTTVLLVDPKLLLPTESTDNTWTGTNTFSSTSTFNGAAVFSGSITGHASTTIRQYTASTTWSKPDGLEFVEVWACGGGGNGDTQGGGGGGGGGCAYEILDSTELSGTSTVTVTVGVAGGTSSFSSFLSGSGGATASTGAGAAGGTATGGDLNLTGGGGGGSETTTAGGGSGGDSFFGRGGFGGLGNPGGAGGAGGAGSSCGGGGGGGGGGSSGGAGAAGGIGCVIVIEHL